MQTPPPHGNKPINHSLRGTPFFYRLVTYVPGDSYSVPHLVDVGEDVGVSDYSSILSTLNTYPDSFYDFVAPNQGHIKINQS